MIELFGELSPILLLAMLPGLIEMLKKWLNLEGTKAEFLGFAVGFILFFTYQLKPLLADEYSTWFNIAFYSILAPLTVMGYYKIIKNSANGLISSIKG